MLTARGPDPWGPPSPVGDAVVAVVVQGVVFRALPGDGGLGAAANPTSKNNGLTCLTCDLTQGDDEFWGNCVRKEPVSQSSGPCPAPTSLPLQMKQDAAQAQSSTENLGPLDKLECPQMLPRPML